MQSEAVLYGLRDPRDGMDAGFAIPDSEIRNPQSAIRNQSGGYGLWVAHLGFWQWRQK